MTSSNERCCCVAGAAAETVITHDLVATVWISCGWRAELSARLKRAHKHPVLVRQAVRATKKVTPLPAELHTLTRVTARQSNRCAICTSPHTAQHTTAHSTPQHSAAGSTAAGVIKKQHQGIRQTMLDKEKVGPVPQATANTPPRPHHPCRTLVDCPTAPSLHPVGLSAVSQLAGSVPAHTKAGPL